MEWNIAKSQYVCSACEKELSELEKYTSALLFEEDTFLRRDYCLPCWESNTPDAFSFWRTEVPKKEEDRKRMVDAHVLLELFRRLDTETDRHKLNFQFLLGLILLRKKVLRLANTHFQNGSEYLILTVPKEDRTYEVVNPRMTDEETETVRTQLAQVFEADFSAVE